MRASDLGPIAWRGEDGPGPWTFTATTPHAYRDESGYPLYLISGTLTAEPNREPTLHSVTITATGTGDAVTFVGRIVTMTSRPGASGDEVRRLWIDARKIAKAARGIGGPPRGTGVTVGALVQAAVELRGDDGWPTEEVVAERLHVSDRWVREVAAPAGGWDGVLALAARQTGSG